MTSYQGYIINQFDICVKNEIQEDKIYECVGDLNKNIRLYGLAMLLKLNTIFLKEE